MSTDAAKDVPPSKPPLAFVPVILTVLATVLAGLSNAEMTRAMFYRSTAAQAQSKAGDQWNFFQAKRIRGTVLDVAADPDGDAEPLDAARITEVVRAAGGTPAARALADFLQSDRGQLAVTAVTGAFAPPRALATPPATIAAMLDAIRQRKTEVQTKTLAAKIDTNAVHELIRDAEEAADAFDRDAEAAIKAGRELTRLWAEAAKADDVLKAVSLRRAERAATAKRYAVEAALNRVTAEYFEVLVRRYGFESERHRRRSGNFFYAMLGAQLGVTVASLALARAERSYLWATAGFAGAAALAFAAFVYFTV